MTVNVTTDDLALYLNDGNINVARAQKMIDRAMTLCESIVSPLPDAAAVVVERVAGRGYVTTTTVRNAQLAAAGSPMGGPGAAGGVWLSRTDKADLRRLGGGSGGSFTIDLLPQGYTAPPTTLYVSPDDGFGGDWDAGPAA